MQLPLLKIIIESKTCFKSNQISFMLYYPHFIPTTSHNFSQFEARAVSFQKVPTFHVSGQHPPFYISTELDSYKNPLGLEIVITFGRGTYCLEVPFYRLNWSPCHQLPQNLTRRLPFFCKPESCQLRVSL